MASQASLRMTHDELVGDGYLDIGVDEATRTLQIRCGGVWSLSDTMRHMQATRVAVEAARTRYGRVKVLVDAANGITQSPEALAYVEHMDALVYRPGDRVAIIVASCLMKMHSKQVDTCAQKEAFISRSAALTWLHAHS